MDKLITIYKNKFLKLIKEAGQTDDLSWGNVAYYLDQATLPEQDKAIDQGMRAGINKLLEEDVEKSTDILLDKAKEEIHLCGGVACSRQLKVEPKEEGWQENKDEEGNWFCNNCSEVFEVNHKHKPTKANPLPDLDLEKVAEILADKEWIKKEVRQLVAKQIRKEILDYLAKEKGD